MLEACAPFGAWQVLMASRGSGPHVAGWLLDNGRKLPSAGAAGCCDTCPSASASWAHIKPRGMAAPLPTTAGTGLGRSLMMQALILQKAQALISRQMQANWAGSWHQL